MTSSNTDNRIIHKINFTDQQAHTDIDKVLNKIKFDQFQLLLALKIVGTCVTCESFISIHSDYEIISLLYSLNLVFGLINNPTFCLAVGGCNSFDQKHNSQVYKRS